MISVYLKELRSYFTTFTSYAVYALMFLICGIYVFVININGGSASYESSIVNSAVWMFILGIPLLTMRVFAEEQKQRTDQLLFSLPLSTTQVTFGKFFAAVTVLLVPTCFFVCFAFILSAFGTINFAAVFSSLLCFILTGAALMAVGLFVSSLVENQIVSAIVTAVLIFLNYFFPSLASYVSGGAASSVAILFALGIVIGLLVYFVTKNYIVGIAAAVVINFALVLTYTLDSALLEGLLPDIMSKISLFDRMNAAASGTFDLTSLLFYVSVAGVFIFLTVQSVEKRRWD